MSAAACGDDESSNTTSITTGGGGEGGTMSTSDGGGGTTSTVGGGGSSSGAGGQGGDNRGGDNQGGDGGAGGGGGEGQGGDNQGGEGGGDVGDVLAPVVTIVGPRDSIASASRRVTVSGVVTDDFGVAELEYESGVGVELIDLTSVAQDGSFTAVVELAPGTNEVTLRARDEAGNEGSAVTHVHFGHLVSGGNSQGATLRDGKLYTWGRNELGQLGNGTLEGSGGWGEDPVVLARPVRFEHPAADYVSIVTRQTFMIALRSGGTVMTWGSNGYGQLGYTTASDCGSQGTSPCERAPKQALGISDAIAVQAGTEHALVLLADGTVMAMGRNNRGQLGRDVAITSSNVPEMIAGLSDIVQIASTSETSFAVTADGEVYAWGDNSEGQLGLGTNDSASHPVPTLIAGLTDVAAITGSNTTVYALKTDGTILAWGRNNNAQIGNGTTGGRVLVPTPVLDHTGAVFTNVESIAADGFVAAAVTKQGVPYTWGWGFLGQLGQGNLPNGDRDLDNRTMASPVFVSPVNVPLWDILEVDCGSGGPCFARSRAGHVFGWGWSFQGSLGLQGAIQAWAYSTPVVVLAATP